MNMSQEEFEKALPLALGLFKSFFNELTTATTNSIKNFEGAMWRNPGMVNSVSYYKGKRDAFAELSGRIEKEYYLTVNKASYIDPKCTSFQTVRDEDVEKVFPEREGRGRYEYTQCMMHRRALADLLEAYMREGFRMGCRYQESQSREQLEFNPVELTDACIDALVDPRYRKEQP